MFCSSCGKEISDTAKFCKHCGYNLVDEVQEATPETSAEPIQKTSSVPTVPPVNATTVVNTNEPKEEVVKPKKKRKGCSVVFLMFLLLVLGGVIYLSSVGFSFGGLSFGGGSSGGGSSSGGLNVDNTIYHVGDTITTGDFSFTINEFMYVDGVYSGTLEHDGIPATGPNAQGNTIAWFNFTIENTGSETIDLHFTPLKLVVGDATFDDSNAYIDWYCFETDDINSEIPPYATKNYNSAIFNVPGGVIGQTETYAEIELYGTTYRISLDQ